MCNISFHIWLKWRDIFCGDVEARMFPYDIAHVYFATAMGGKAVQTEAGEQDAINLFQWHVSTRVCLLKI